MKLESIKTRDGYKFRSRFTINNTTFRSPWVVSEKEAKDWAAIKRSEVLTDRVNTGSHINLNSFAGIWLDRHAFVNKVYSAAIGDKQFLNKYVLPALGTRKLKDLTTRDWAFFFGDMSKKNLAPKTVNNILGTVKKMMNDAVGWGFINFNPAAAVKPLKLSSQEVTTFTRNEIQKILAFTKGELPEYYELIVFCVNVGCRLGEAIGLRWTKVDLENGFAIISATFNNLERRIVERTKGKRFRKVPLNKEAITILRSAALSGRQRRSELAFPDVNYHTLTNKLFRWILKQSGCADALKRKASFHTLRHTFASEFMRSGGNIYQLQKILGHSSVTQTEKYSHFSPDFLAGATERVSFSAPAMDPIPGEFGKNRRDLAQNLAQSG